MTLPFQLRESQFRRFETQIAEAVSAYPSVYLVTTPAIAPTTRAARLRDAMLSLSQHNWKTSLIDMTAFREVYPHLQVAHSGSKVATGSLESLREWRKTLDTKTHDLIPEGADVIEFANFPGCSFTNFNTICKLGHMRLLRCSIVFPKPNDLTPDLIEEAERSFDIAFQQDKEGVWTLLV